MSIASVFRPLALAVLMLAGTTMAAFPQVDDDAVDPPGRVGRLGYVEGTVSFRNADEDQWVPATLNYPVTTGDAFWTQPNSRAEIQIGSTDLRLDQTTAIQVIQLDDGATQIQVDQGSINLRVREVPPGGVRILTPRVSLEVIQPGRYHVDVAAPQGSEPGNEVRIAVLEGAARVDGLAAPLTVTAGHSATLRAGDAYPLLAQAITRPLDTWALERERLLTPRIAEQYISPEMTGARDLDNYGQWGNEPSYGAVWYPQAVPADWAPYRYGHWAIVAPWGWTWIDQQPWGFAPFHYGRWVRVRDRWGWCPGVRVHRPVYAPALVAFAASGGGGVLVTAGSRPPLVGWVPLGPREVYRPYYRHSPRYVRDVNVTHVHVTNVTVINRGDDRDGRSFRGRDGFTAVPAKSFTGAMAADKARVLVRDNDWADARRADSLGDFKPSRSARAGVVVPAVATAPAEPRQRGRRGDRDDAFTAPANTARPAPVTAARDPDVVPRAPGPDRWQRASATPERQRPAGGSPASGPRDREPAASPFQRGNQAAPALRAPDSPTAATPALRAEPPGRAPNATVAPVPGRTPNTVTNSRPNDPPGRAPNNNRDMRDNRDGPRIDNAPRAPQLVAPTQPQRPLPPSQTPGSAPNTVAPQRPTPVTPPSANQPDRRDSRRLDSERRFEPPRATNPTPQQRAVPPPPREPSQSQQRAPRPEQAAPPQRSSPPPGRQPERQQERDVRREPMRHEQPNRTVITPPQQSVRPAPQQQPQRQIVPQTAERERRSPPPQAAPSRPQQSSPQSNSSSRSESRGRGNPDERRQNRAN